MVNPNDEEWLKRVLEGCFADKQELIRDEKTLKRFRMLVASLVKNIEKNLAQAEVLWETNPKSKEFKEKFQLLKNNLFYLRRFCEGKEQR